MPTHFLGRVQLILLRLWLWFKERSQSPYAYLWLSLYSFSESFILPFPVDPFLVAMIIANRSSWLKVAFVATASSTLGAVAGYAMGFAAFGYIGLPLLEFTGTQESFMQVERLFQEKAFLLTFVAAFTPFPNPPVVVGAGFLHYAFFTFLISWLIGRTMRFYGVAYIVYAYDLDALTAAERYLRVGTTVFALVSAGWITMRLLGAQ